MDTNRLHDSFGMIRTKSQLSIGTIALMILLPIVVAATWFGRGLYDRLFILEGQVVAVNATANDRTGRFVFPSGEEIKADLKAGVSSQFVVGKTGEGSVDVTVDGIPGGEVGYVTSRNGMIIFTIDEDSVFFSQVSL